MAETGRSRFAGPPHKIAGTDWDVRFVVMELTGLLAIAAGAMYWLIPKLLGRNSKIDPSEAVSKSALSQVQIDKLFGGILLAAGNVAIR